MQCRKLLVCLLFSCMLIAPSGICMPPHTWVPEKINERNALKRWCISLKAAIEKQKEFLSLKEALVNKTVCCTFILSKGKQSNFKITTSSGSSALDSAVLSMLKKVEWLPNTPLNSVNRLITVRLSNAGPDVFVVPAHSQTGSSARDGGPDVFAVPANPSRTGLSPRFP